MPSPIKITAGATIVSIARQHGVAPQRIWDDPANAELRQRRPSQNILAAGDEVVVPDPRIKEESRPTGARHKFKLVGQKVKLKLRFKKMGEPRANERCVIVIDGVLKECQLDGNGEVELMIPADAVGGAARFNDGREVYPIRIGHLDPVDLISGVKQRLNNLGYRAGDEDLAPSEELTAALKRFQAANNLPETGEADAATKAKLAELHP